MHASRQDRLLGMATIVLAIGFNAPYAILAATYDYPGILREPAGVALSAFHAGGASLVWTWYAFGLCALALVPIGVALAVTPDRINARPRTAMFAAIAGALAGFAQAVGLFRWVFVVPALAQQYAEAPDAAAQLVAAATFETLNAYGGVAIGEHLGQLLTAAFVAGVAAMQTGENKPLSAPLGFLTASLLVIGSGEGLAIGLRQSGDIFSIATIAGFATFTAWLVATGAGLCRGR